jgi:hypothetical protein
MRSTYERIAEKILEDLPKPRKAARFVNGRLYAEWKSQHRSPQSRRWSLFWRLKQVRKTT